MKITKLIINNQYIDFSKNTLIFSKYNSTGKTTLLRLVLYSLGFPIPSTKGLEFNNLTTQIQLVVGHNHYEIVRYSDLLILYQNDKLLQKFNENDRNEMFSIIFGITNNLIIKNILGVFYFDQEKGWTLLNRGKVIGNISFNIEEYLEGIDDDDLSDYREEISRLTREIKFYNSTEKLITLNNNEPVTSFDISPNDQHLSNVLFTKKLEMNGLKNQISQMTEVKRNNKDLLRIINECHLIINIGHGKRVRVSKDNLSNYNINNSIVNAKLLHLKRQLSKQKQYVNNLKDKMRYIDLTHGETQLDKFKRIVGNIDMTPESIESISNDLKNKRLDLHHKIQKILKQSDAMINLYHILAKFSNELGVKKYIDNTPNFILTSNIKRYSGAIFHLIIFAYRMSLLRLVEKTYSVTLPVIIDSPATGELDSENLKKIFKLIHLEFSKNQVIVASINKLNNVNINWKRIILHNKLFTSLHYIND